MARFRWLTLPISSRRPSRCHRTIPGGGHCARDPSSGLTKPVPAFSAYRTAIGRPLVALALAIIHRGFPDNVSLKALSDEVGLSPCRVSRTFRAMLGASLRDYVAERRVALARDLLRRSGHSITEIAHLVGFGDLPRFDKVFRRRTGLTPSGYRNRTSGPGRAKNY
jgi:transcriptional regulator GlxA family with amidase domain